MSEAKATLQRRVDELEAKNARLWEILKLPGLEANRVLAEFPPLVASFTPPGEGLDHRVVRGWHRTVARALEDRIQEAYRGRG
jgi:hypothetical protein